MKGRVYRRGKTYTYVFDISPDPLTGKRCQQTKGGYPTEKEAWKACRDAMKEHEDGQYAKPSKRTVEQALTDWLPRIQHAVKPSMWANYRNYAAYYVIPHIGQRVVQELDGSVIDALYAKLLAEGRCKKNAHKPGLAPKTVVNAHRMLHRAWEDFTAWGWAKRNVVKDAHPPRIPHRGRTTWNVEQLQRFLITAREDRFFALWVLEATSGMRRCELAGVSRNGLDLDEGTLTITDTRVVIDGKVDISDGKTVNARRMIALDPFTLAALKAHLVMLDAERAAWGPDYQDHGLLFCWEDGRPPHPDTITARFMRLTDKAGLPRIRLHDVRHSYATAGRNARIDWKALSQRIGHSDVAFTMRQYVQTDLDVDRKVARALADLIVSGVLTSIEIEEVS